MHLIVIGVNYKKSDISLLERLNICEDKIDEKLFQFKSLEHIEECLILATCNRIEFYAYTNLRSDNEIIIKWIKNSFSISEEELANNIYSYAGHKCIEHLFRVASGLDSISVGEHQILAQVKNAYKTTFRIKTVAKMLGTLFQRALSVGKKVRSKTNISKKSQSLIENAIYHINLANNYKTSNIVVLGAGEMGEQACLDLHKKKYGLIICNRTKQKADMLAKRCNGKSIILDDIFKYLKDADVFISAIKCNNPIINKNQMLEIMQLREKPLYIVDLGVPRNIDGEVKKIPGISLYDIDDLKYIMKSSKADFCSEIENAKSIVNEEVSDFLNWYRIQDAVPIITKLRNMQDDIIEIETQKLTKLLPNLTNDQLKFINKSMKSVSNKLLHNPLLNIRNYASGENSSMKLEIIEEIFGIHSEN